MDPALRRVTRLPLTEIWNDEGPVAVRKGDLVGNEDIRGFLRTEQGPLVEAFIGCRMRWYAGNARFAFWKEELRDRMIEPEEAVGGFPNPERPFYLVYEWFLEESDQRVLVAEGAD